MTQPAPEGYLARRQASVWTRIHPFFAFGQLLTFLVSVGLLVAYLFGKVSFSIVAISVLIKIGLMAGAMLTGAFWEQDVFGQFWFAPEFFVEDVITVIVFALHLAYLYAVYAAPFGGKLALPTLAIAYTAYAINVGQYVIRHNKVRQDERELSASKRLRKSA
ncbi:MAG: 2-vinyl bacteriochlorophyllide hydratase [Candidatus Baltobacteraceae bacterium]|jgi:3-vinyl bacteriochlorophyllide hydratase